MRTHSTMQVTAVTMPRGRPAPARRTEGPSVGPGGLRLSAGLAGGAVPGTQLGPANSGH